MPKDQPESKSPLTDSGSSDPLEKLLQKYLNDFISHNRAARVVAQGLKCIGIGFRPVVDHLTFRTLSVEERVMEFLPYGYEHDASLGLIGSENGWAKVYRKNGYPALFIEQAYDGPRGKGSLIPEWLKTFGDQHLHHASILVDDIEAAVFYLEKQNVPFAGNIAGDRGADLRQIFSEPEMLNGKPFTVLKLTERHRGYAGFLPSQAPIL